MLLNHWRKHFENSSYENSLSVITTIANTLSSVFQHIRKRHLLTILETNLIINCRGNLFNIHKNRHIWHSVFSIAFLSSFNDLTLFEEKHTLISLSNYLSIEQWGMSILCSRTLLLPNTFCSWTHFVPFCS